MSWIMAGIAAASAMANIGMRAGGVGQSSGSETTGGVMSGVNGILSSLMGSALGGGESSMAPTPALNPPSAQSLTPPPTQMAQNVPGTSPWGMPVSTGMAGGGTAAGMPPPYDPNAWQYQPAASMAPMGPSGMTGGGTAAGMYGAPQPATTPTPPNPYMAAIGAAAPALSNVMAARVAQQRSTETKGSSGYGVPGAITPVTVGGGAPAPRLSPLERYRLMLSGMR